MMTEPNRGKLFLSALKICVAAYIFGCIVFGLSFGNMIMGFYIVAIVVSEFVGYKSLGAAGFLMMPDISEMIVGTLINLILCYFISLAIVWLYMHRQSINKH